MVYSFACPTVHQTLSMLIPADHPIVMYHGMDRYSMVDFTVYQTVVIKYPQCLGSEACMATSDLRNSEP